MCRILYKVIFLTILAKLSQETLSATLPNQRNPGITRQSKYVVSNVPKLEGDLAAQQVETIRQIIAAEEKNRQSYAQVKEISNFAGSKDVPNLEKSSWQEKFANLDRIPTLEELKAQCQHFSKFFNVRHVEQTDDSPTESSSITSGTLRPVYIRNKPTFIQKKNGFFVTVQPIGMKRLTDKDLTTTRRPLHRTTTIPTVPTTATSSTENYTSEIRQNITQSNLRNISEALVTISTTTVLPSVENLTSTKAPAPKIKVKYTRLEPVILQKTILTDGRVLYHWHKALPTSLFDLPVAETPVLQPLAPMMDLPSYSPPMFKFPQPETTTELQTTTTTTEESSWLFVPFKNFFSGGYSEEDTSTTSTTETLKQTSTTTPSTTTTSTTTETPTTTVNTASTTTTEMTQEQVKFQEQLKFVVPVQYGDLDHQISQQRQPWDYHRFAYYPKELQPINTIGNPPLPLLKSVVVPKFNLAYASGPYGLTYPREYGAGYDNYQRYDMPAMTKELDDVSID